MSLIVIKTTPPKPIRQLVRSKQLCPMLGISRATLQRMIIIGDFPPAIRLSKQAVAFDLAEIEAWIETRKANRIKVLQ